MKVIILEKVVELARHDLVVKLGVGGDGWVKVTFKKISKYVFPTPTTFIGWEYGSMAKSLPNMPKALGSILSTY